MRVNAASKENKYYMPTKLVNYSLEKGKWKKLSSHSYKYDSRGNIIKWDNVKLNNVYRNGKLKKVTIKGKNENGEKYNTVKEYNKKGNITYWGCSYGSEYDGMVYLHEYEYNKKGYISKRVNMTEPDTYQYKYHSNGIPSQITHKYFLLAEDGEYKVKTIEKYNKEGIITSGVTYKNNKKVDSFKTKITKKNGKITQIVCSGKENGKAYKWKKVFQYGSAKAKDKDKYVSIMGMMTDGIIFQSIGNNSAIGHCYEY